MDRIGIPTESDCNLVFLQQTPSFKTPQIFLFYWQYSQPLPTYQASELERVVP